VTTIDMDYYRERMREERAREASATTETAAKAHAEMAEEYERVLREAEGEIQD
jgi:hypothetical protein